MNERVIINTCCEDYILQYRDAPNFPLKAFCPVCDTEWRSYHNTYTRVRDDAEFHIDRVFGVEQLRTSRIGYSLQTRRCCTQFAIRYGSFLRRPLPCPHCSDEWQQLPQDSPVRSRLLGTNIYGFLLREELHVYTLRATPTGIDLWYEFDLEN